MTDEQKQFFMSLRELCAKHQASIQVQSEPYSGKELVFSFPTENQNVRDEFCAAWFNKNTDGVRAKSPKFFYLTGGDDER